MNRCTGVAETLTTKLTASPAYKSTPLVPDLTCSAFLISGARDFATFCCTRETCPVCSTFADTWDDLYDALLPAFKSKVDGALEALCVPYPRQTIKEWAR